MSVFVIKTPEVERTRDFFMRLGLTFVEEKHGDGPVHFACEVAGDVFEIYPAEDKSSARFIKET